MVLEEAWSRDNWRPLYSVSLRQTNKEIQNDTRQQQQDWDHVLLAVLLEWPWFRETTCTCRKSYTSVRRWQELTAVTETSPHREICLNFSTLRGVGIYCSDGCLSTTIILRPLANTEKKTSPKQEDKDCSYCRTFPLNCCTTWTRRMNEWFSRLSVTFFFHKQSPANSKISWRLKIYCYIHYIHFPKWRLFIKILHDIDIFWHMVTFFGTFLGGTIH